MKRTLFLNPPSFQDFDGGAGSRYQATREVVSFWYPTWLCYPAGMIPESRVVDATPENLTVEQVAPLARDFDLVVIFTSNASFAADIATISRLKEENPRVLAGLVGPQVTILPEESLTVAPQVDFVARLREERRFPSIDELAAQIRADIDAARRVLAEKG